MVIFYGALKHVLINIYFLCNDAQCAPVIQAHFSSRPPGLCQRGDVQRCHRVAGSGSCRKLSRCVLPVRKKEGQDFCISSKLSLFCLSCFFLLLDGNIKRGILLPEQLRWEWMTILLIIHTSVKKPHTINENLFVLQSLNWSILPCWALQSTLELISRAHRRLSWL